MKKSFSLIELIFTIVIIAFVFTVIPKVIYTTNKTFEFSLKEDGIFNMMTKMMDISTLAWDENNTDPQDPPYNILITEHNNKLECQANINSKDSLRIGGFYSGDEYSRICPKKDPICIPIFGILLCTGGTKITISSIQRDGENSEEDYDDVDDYNNTESNVTKSDKVRYKLYMNIGYSKDWGGDDNAYDYDNQSLTFQFSNDFVDKSNIKLIKITLEDEKYDKNISHARYWSANIGMIQQIESEQW